MQAINSKSAPQPIGAYSQAVVAAPFVFCSGQIAIDPSTGKLVEGDIALQTKRVLENLRSVLDAAKTTPEKIVMTSIFLADMKYFSQVNELYGKFVNTELPPARQTMAVKELPLGALVEISVIALTSS